MDKVYFATTNKNKIASVFEDLKDVVDVVQVEMEIPKPKYDETSMIAKEKVIYAFKHIKKPCVAQDGGFYIASLKGFPKSYVNFTMKTIGLEGILNLVKGKERFCEFRDTLAFIDELLDEPILFETITKGLISKEPKGKLKIQNWRELHKIFIPQGTKKTLAEMNEDELEEWQEERKSDWCGQKFGEWIKTNRQKV